MGKSTTLRWGKNVGARILSTPERSINLMGLKLPDIKLDPSTIKDRWALAAFLGLVWIVIAYLCLSNPDADILITLAILFITIIVIFLILSITVSEAPIEISSEKIKIPPPRDYIPSEDKPTPKQIKRILAAWKLWDDDPEIRKVLTDSKQGDY